MQFTTKVRVRYAETDQMGVVYHANYLIYLEVSRVEALRKLGVKYSELEQQGILFPVVDLHVQYLRPAFYDQELTVSTQFLQINPKQIIIENQIWNDQNIVILKAKVILVCVDKMTMRATTIPAEILNVFQK